MRLAAWVVVALAFSVVAAGSARADADPASDTLYTQRLFLPYTATISKPVEAELVAAIQKAASARKQIRVALIASPQDLGGVPQLFTRGPKYYTRFLDAELQFVYKGRLLVVMPQGAGYAKGGKLIPSKAVDAVRPGPSGDALARAATQLVEKLAGVKVAAAPATTTGSVPAGSGRLPTPHSFPVRRAALISVGAVALLLVLGGFFVMRRRRA